MNGQRLSRESPNPENLLLRVGAKGTRTLRRGLPKGSGVALAAGPADRAAAHLDLAEAYLLAGQLPQAKQQTLHALEIAPSFERAQELLLKIVDGQVQ